MEKPNVKFEQAPLEDFHKYTRVQRRWAHQHLYDNGLKLQNPSDKRVVEFLDDFYGKVEDEVKSRRKMQIKKSKKAIRKAKWLILICILLRPFFWLRKIWRRLWQNNS